MTMLRPAATTPVQLPLNRLAPGTFGEGLARIPRFGQRCPDCGGPLAFGEGCHLCPICGHSACA